MGKKESKCTKGNITEALMKMYEGKAKFILVSVEQKLGRISFSVNTGGFDNRFEALGALEKAKYDIIESMEKR